MLTRTIIARSHAQHRAAHAEELLLQDIDDDDLPLETDTISNDLVLPLETDTISNDLVLPFETDTISKDLVLPLETDTISKDGVEQAKSGADL